LKIDRQASKLYDQDQIDVPGLGKRHDLLPFDRAKFVRTADTRNYFSLLGDDRARTLLLCAEYEQQWLNKLQPWRTDIETMISDDIFVEVAINPAPGR
jgi:hypothetical protein